VSRFGFKVKARGRTTPRKPGTMNGTEARYELEMLKRRQQCGDVVQWWFEAFTIKLGPDLRYTPDFAVLLRDESFEFHEIKAGTADGKPRIEDDARVKLIMAAELMPFAFKLCWWHKDYGWKEKEY
jgi:hypothetical protein